MSLQRPFGLPTVTLDPQRPTRTRLVALQDPIDEIDGLVAELLLRWGRVASVKRQIDESDKQPRRGTVPLLTVPIRLDLPNELVKSFRP